MSLPSPAEKRAAVEAMFDRIAPRYDLVNRLMTLGADRSWRRRAVAALGVGPGDLVLDLACGTGDLAAEATAAGARVVGIDFSAGMLRVAAARRVGPLVRGDATALPFSRAMCDAVVSGFALRNFTDLGAALAECARVLRPGGSLALLEVDAPRNRLLGLGHRLYFERVVPWIGGLLADRPAYRYLPASVTYLPPERELRALVAAAGFGSIEKQRLLGGAAQLLCARRLA